MDLMGVFEVVVVDRRSNEILKKDFVTAVNESAAMAQLQLVDTKRMANGELAVFGKKIGEYEPIRPVEIKNVD